MALLIGFFLRTNHAYITTPSMYPTIPPGSMTFIAPEPKYKVGDIIEFRANGLLWIHRLVGVRPNGTYITKGDNPQSTPDVFAPEINKQNVVGKVTTSIPYLGFPELLIHQPSYGLSWLRAELGFTGKAMLLGIIILSTAFVFWRKDEVADVHVITLPADDKGSDTVEPVPARSPHSSDTVNYK